MNTHDLSIINYQSQKRIKNMVTENITIYVCSSYYYFLYSSVMNLNDNKIETGSRCC